MAGALAERVIAPEITVDDLAEAGFASDDIERLRELKQGYPFVEYVDSGQQWQRLLFLKWRYQSGDLRRD